MKLLYITARWIAYSLTVVGALYCLYAALKLFKPGFSTYILDYTCWHNTQQ
jgi:hypothetical protein